mmetsp:Transcript_5792/g.13642  ORF Transcript_5792/g.13642 Transcript_5792/m.13642 type:complete len:190 (+) Transcript_5792:69-638(+)
MSRTAGRAAPDAAKEPAAEEPAAEEPAAAAAGPPARGGGGAAKAKAKGKAKAAGPARGVVKAAAKPGPKAKGKAKGKAVAARGPIKAIAAKEFAGIAAKLKKSKSEETPAGEGTWYFMSDLRKLKEGVDDDKAWTKYDAKMQKALEMAYSKGFKQYTMKFKDKEYMVRFKTMMQFRTDDKSLQRPVKRI